MFCRLVIYLANHLRVTPIVFFIFTFSFFAQSAKLCSISFYLKLKTISSVFIGKFCKVRLIALLYFFRLENPQTAVAHTDSSSTESSSSKASSPTQDTRDADKNSGATWSSGFQGLFALVSACFSIFVLLSQNIMTMPGWKLRRLTSSRQKYSRRAACLPKHPDLLKKVFRFLFHRK